MSHELPDAKSVLMLRSVRTKNGKRTSNIVWGHEQSTIPRHLRDVVVTEYGIADLRGKSDADVIKQLLNVTDAEFQAGLLQTAKKNGKIELDYEVPDWAKRNTPQQLKNFLSIYQKKNFFPAYPFGSDFTEEEQALYAALTKLQEAQSSLSEILKYLWRGFLLKKESHRKELERMQLFRARGLKEFAFQRLILAALAEKD
jgi:hypothetical protein